MSFLSTSSLLMMKSLAASPSATLAKIHNACKTWPPDGTGYNLHAKSKIVSIRIYKRAVASECDSSLQWLIIQSIEVIGESCISINVIYFTFSEENNIFNLISWQTTNLESIIYTIHIVNTVLLCTILKVIVSQGQSLRSAVKVVAEGHALTCSLTSSRWSPSRIRMTACMIWLPWRFMIWSMCCRNQMLIFNIRNYVLYDQSSISNKKLG